MERNHLTTEELEAENLFKQAIFPAPSQKVAQTIVAHFKPVTTTVVDRIPGQDNTKGRDNNFFNLRHIIMSWKKIIPVGALTALLILAVIYKPQTAQTPTNQKKFETKISAAGALSDNDVEIAADELAAELSVEENWDDESADLAAEALVTFEPIYQTYEL